MREFKRGTIVKHFKYETLTSEEKEKRKYLYEILGKAKHTETGEELMVYQALYEPFEMSVRPLSMFNEKVDRQKYPDVRQEYRFEEIIQAGSIWEE